AVEPATSAPLDDDLAAALSAALADAPRSALTAPEPADTAASLFGGMSATAIAPSAPVDTPVEAAAAEPQPVETADETWERWRREDDDILPKRGRRRFSFRRRR